MKFYEFKKLGKKYLIFEHDVVGDCYKKTMVIYEKEFIQRGYYKNNMPLKHELLIRHLYNLGNI